MGVDMGLSTSSAARAVDLPSFGSLGGRGERAFKKKPVLVLDPEELAKAHHLFQVGAAEQLGDYDPAHRGRPAPVFGLTIVPQDIEDDYVSPIVLIEEDELPEDDLPPIDLAAVLAMTEAEQALEDAFERAMLEQEAAAEPEELPVAEEALPEPAEPAEALLPFLEQTFETEQFKAPDETAAQPGFASLHNGTEPVHHGTEADQHETEAPQHEPEIAFELEPEHEFDGEAFVLPEAPLRILPIFETGERSQLRARLVREELTLAHPEPSAWRKLMIALRRLWARR